MEFSQNLRLAHLQLQMNTSAKFKVNQKLWEELSGQAFLGPIRGYNSVILDGIIAKFASCTSTAPNEHFSQVSTNWTEMQEEFLLFQKCFLLVWGTFSHFHQNQNYCLQNLSA